MDANQTVTEVKKLMRELLNGKSNLADALDLSLEDILALAQIARQFAEQGQTDTAQTLLEGLISIDPQNAYLHTCLGCVYMQRGMTEAAFDAFNIALFFNKDDIVARTYAGELALEQGLVETAAEHLKRAVELDPDGKNPWANRARTSALLMSTIVNEVQQKGTGVLHEMVTEARRVQGNA